MAHQGEVNQPKRFLQPCLLLMVAESPAHGYELLERLGAFGFDRDPGGLYRALRSMEREGLLNSEWDFSAAGPGRRRYQLTPRGRQRLDSWAESLVETRRIVETYLERYQNLVQRPGPPPGRLEASLPADFIAGPLERAPAMPPGRLDAARSHEGHEEHTK